MVITAMQRIWVRSLDQEGPLEKGRSAAASAAKSLQPCPTLWDPIDSSPPGSPIPGILQARTLESVAISSSDAWKWKVKVKSLSGVRFLATPWTAAYQVPPTMGFSRQEYWSGLPLPSPEGKVYPLQYSRLENSTDRGAWWATVRGVAESRTGLSEKHNIVRIK